MAGSFKNLNLCGFTATQTFIFWFAFKSLGKVFGVVTICFAIHLSLFSRTFDFGDFVALSQGAILVWAFCLTLFGLRLDFFGPVFG
jgi:hypothetical protein